MLSAMGRTFRRMTTAFGRRQGVESRPAVAAGREMPPLYYDEAFRTDQHFRIPFYKSAYYPTWLVVADRLRRYGCTAILDVGCGPGQFAELVSDWDFTRYTGLDFSPEAIRMAQDRAPRFSFKIGDIRDPRTYEGIAFDAIVCMEVLEHLHEDLRVIECFRSGARCLMTVPNFPWRSHVRHFESGEAVSARYGRFFQDFSVTRVKGVRGDTIQFYLLDGIRNATRESSA